MLLPERVAAVAEGACGHPQQPAVTFLISPGEQGGIFGQQLLQTFDVIVVNGALGLGCRPLQALTHAFEDLLGEVLPPGNAIFAREHQLGITAR